MKKFAHIVLMLLTAVWTAAASEPENFIPRQAPGVIRADVNRMLTSPELKSAIDSSREIKNILEKVENMLQSSTDKKIKLSDLFSSQLWFAQTGRKLENFTAYSKTAVPEKELHAAVSKNPNCRIVDAAGKKAVVYEQQSEKLVLVYLAEDVMMISRMTSRLPQEITASLQGGGNPLLSQVNRNTLAAGAVDMAKASGKRKPKVKFINAQLDADKAMNLAAQVSVRCKNSQEALKMAMQIQFAAPAAFGMYFSNDEKLAAALSEGLQVVPQDDAVIINYDLKFADFKKAVKYMSQSENLPRREQVKGSGSKRKKQK